MPKRVSLGPLSAIEFEAGRDAKTLVLFHGYGADGADLAPLAPELGLPPKWRCLFPDAPGQRHFMGMPAGRMWFPIDEEAIQRAQMSGKPVDWSKSEPKGFSDARQAAEEFLKEGGIAWDRLVLGGFSQGAILATDLALRAPKAPLGLVILSGNLVAAEEWRKLAESRRGLPFFQSHGIVDPILGYQGARRLSDLLKSAGLEGDLLSFEGGHAIPQEVLDALSAFLAAL